MPAHRARRSATTLSIGDLAARVGVPLTPETMLSAYASRFTINALRRTYRLFDGDLTLFLVFGEIAQYNVSHALQTLNVQDVPDSASWRSLMRILQEQKVAPCNALSISQATGIPRETVRGKVKALEKRGWLVREGARSLTLAPVAVEQLRPLEREIMEDFRETARMIRLIEDAFALQRKNRASRAGGKPGARRTP
jgi:hypothetical protein